MMKIVIALDRSRHDRAAVQLLQQLRWPTRSVLTLLHMLEIVTIPGGWQLHYRTELWKPLTAERRKVFAQAKRFLERLGGSGAARRRPTGCVGQVGPAADGDRGDPEEATGGSGRRGLSRAFRRAALPARKRERRCAQFGTVIGPDQPRTREGSVPGTCKRPADPVGGGRI